MKKLVWLAPMLLLASVVFGKREGGRLDVYLNFNDCINCTIGLSLVNELPPEIAVRVFVDKSNKASAPAFLASYGIGRDRISLHELSRPLLLESYYTFSLKKELVLRGTLKEMSKMRELFIALNNTSKDLTSISINHPLPVSTRAKYFADESSLIATDYLSGRAFVVNYDARSFSATWSEFLLDSSLPAEIRDSLAIDPNMYQFVKPILVQLGKVRPRICSATYKDGLVHIAASMTLPKVEANGDTALAEFFFLVSQGSNKRWSYRFVNPNAYDEHDGHSWDVEESFQVLSDSTALFPLFNDSPSRSGVRLAAIVLWSDSGYRLSQFLPLERPSLFDSLGYGHNFSNIGISDGIAFMRSYPSLVMQDWRTAKDFRELFESYFKARYGPRAFPFYFFDWRLVDEDHLAVLFMHENRCYWAIIDVIQQRFIRVSRVVKKGVDWAATQFDRTGRLILISIDHAIILRTKDA